MLLDVGIVTNNKI